MPNNLTNELNAAYDEIPNWSGDTNYRLSFAMTKPHPVAVKTISKFLKKNNNNTGLHTDKTNLSGTRELERKSIELICSYIGCGVRDGYITSGGTEGNTVGLWIGRNKLRKTSKRIAILSNAYAHVCLEKAADILDIPIYKCMLNDDLTIKPSSVIHKINELKAKGYDGFILYLTQGYYSTGMVDDVSAIYKQIPNRLSNQIYIHIDACLGGFVLPFSDDFDTRSVSPTIVDSISLDPHKFGLMPYSCGLVLANKGHFKHISRVSSIAHNTEDTLSGSRAGSTAAGLYALLKTLGREGYRKNTKKCLSLKRYSMDEIKKIDPKAEFIDNPKMALFSVSFSQNKLPKDFCDEYRLVGSKLKNEKYFYNIFLLPHFNKKVIDSFLKDLSRHL